jgi:DNA-binding NarL/FixJ family response regulator
MLYLFVLFLIGICKYVFMKKSYNILLIDAFSRVANAYRYILETESICKDVIICDSYQSVTEVFKSQKIDIAIIDFSNSSFDAFEIFRFIRNNYKEIKIICVKVFPDYHDVIISQTIGANAFMPKEAAPERLVSVIEKVISGQSYFPDRKDVFVLE